MVITDLQNRSHVFTLTDGSTLRVFARKSSKDINEKLISDEIRTAEKLGIVRIGNPKSAPARGKSLVPSGGNNKGDGGDK